MDVNQALQQRADAMASTQNTQQGTENNTQNLNIPEEKPQATTTTVIAQAEVKQSAIPTKADLVTTTDSNTGLEVLVDELGGGVAVQQNIVDRAYADEVRHGDYIPKEGVELNGSVIPKEQINVGDDPLMMGLLKQNEIANKAKANLEARALANDGETPSILNTSDDEVDRIDALLSQLEDDKKRQDVGITEEDSIQSMLDKLEADKTFTTYKEAEAISGPADYQVIENKEYVDSLDEILDVNNIKIVRKSGSERNATLDRFANSGTNISVVLPNSGIFVTVSGAGSGELVAMSNVKGQTPAIAELNKIDHVAQHITASTVGRLSSKQLIKIISNSDKDTLYYALYAATYPEVSELNRTCAKCNGEFFMKVRTKDLLLNGKEFEDKANYIRTDVSKFTDLVATSELGKTKVMKHSSGMIVYYRHPSMEQYILSLNAISPKVIEKYGHLVDVVYNIERIAVPTGNGDYIEYTKPEELIIVLSKLRTATERFEIMDMIEKVRPAAVPTYGFQECTCPHCGAKNDKMPFIMEQLLFFKATSEEQLEAYKWAARNEKKKKEEKNSKN